PPRSPRAGATAGAAQGQRFADAQALLHRGNVQMIEIPNGALLIFEVADRALVSSLRTEIQESAQAVQQGRCPLAFQLESA
nr:hypothetical protein [Myxococcota bacterium]